MDDLCVFYAEAVLSLTLVGSSVGAQALQSGFKRIDGESIGEIANCVDVDLISR
jgi:hypothetical protein